MSHLLKVKSLSVFKRGSCICRLNDFSVTGYGTYYVYGENGSGKTTFLRVLAGLESVYTGSVYCIFQSNDILYVPANPFVFKGSVEKNANLIIKHSKFSRKFSKSSRCELLSRLREELGEYFMSKDAFALSSGERKRFFLYLAYLFSPRLLLLDEPFSDLDSCNTRRFSELLFSNKGSVVVVASPLYVGSEIEDSVVGTISLSDDLLV